MVSTTTKTIGGYTGHAVSDAGIVTMIKDLVGGLSPHGKFPGPNPCSLERADLSTLDPADYLICEKTDGTRMLLVFLMYDSVRYAFLVTRAWDVFMVGVRCCPKILFQGTVLDGELIGKTWLGFDAMFVAGVPIHTLNLERRVSLMQRACIGYVAHPNDSLSIRFKSYHRSFDFASELESDGYILMPERDPVVVGRHIRLYKLKHTGKHTVDFSFVLPDELYVYDSATDSHRRVGRLIGDIPSAPCIVEASHVDGETWSLVKVRDDKTTANDVLTYTKTMVNIRENITVDELVRHWRGEHSVKKKTVLRRGKTSKNQTNTAVRAR